ncbi:palmitoyltransferase hip14 [Anaeramoeba ignava]|uniref:Palmitoyltransferase n=1 Tax=Anaeramoeba ignava TaxID=1746090 RepID=A0A9Q0RF72_ANAIG|nr:palmitoyltransferase hip14 [Anaeramoeba ignava]
MQRNSNSKSIQNPNRKKIYIENHLKHLIITNNIELIIKHIEDYKISREIKDENGNGPIHWAAENNRAQVIEALIKMGFPIDNSNYVQSTPLHLACTKDSVSIIKLLLENGADLYKTDEIQSTAIHVATQCNAYLVVQYLISNYPEIVDLPDQFQNQTPLHWASHRGNYDIAVLLIKNGANINKQDNTGNTPLHLACKHGNRKIVELLLKNNTDFLIKNNSQETPIDLAVHSGKIETARFIKIYTAKNFQFKFFKDLSNKKRLTIFSLLPGFAMFISYFLFAKLHLFFAVSIILIISLSIYFNIERWWNFYGELDLPPTPWQAGYTLSIMFHLYISYFLYFMFVSFPVLPVSSTVLVIASFFPLFSLYKLFTVDPGFIEQKKISLEEALQTYKEVSHEDYCYTCKIIKPLRSKHDRVTDRCIGRFDHYCTWLYCPIGYKNHIYFISMVFWSSLNIYIYTYLFFKFVHQTFNYNQNGAFQFFQIKSYFDLIISSYKIQPWVLAVILWSLTLGFYMTYTFVQAVYFLFINLTTNESLNWKKYPIFLKNGKFFNPYSKGFRANLAQFFNWNKSIDWNNLFNLNQLEFK